MKHKKFIIIGAVIALIVLILILNFNNNFFTKKTIKEDFNVDNLFLKVSMETNKNIINNIKLTNNKDKLESFSIVSFNLGNLVSVEESNFKIEPNQEKNIAISFNTNGKEPKVYLGGLRIISAGVEKTIPVILEVQSEDIAFDSNVNLYPQGDVILGQKLSANIKIFDLKGSGISKINLIYSVNYIEGKKLVSESEDLVVDGKLDYLKTINLPEDIEKGTYVLSVIVNYNNSIGTSTTIFNVIEKNSSQNQTENQTLIFWVIVIFVLFFLAFFVLFFYSLIYRDKLLEEIQLQYRREIRRQDKLIRYRQRQDYGKLGSPLERRVYRKELKKVKEKRAKAIHAIHKKRLKEYERIKKRGNKNQLKIQIAKWKKQGYDTSVLDNQFKIPSASDIKRKIAVWKAKGYDTGVLVSE